MPLILASLGASAVSEIALFEEGRRFGNWEDVQDKLAFGTVGFAVAVPGAQARDVGAAVALWFLSIAFGSGGSSPLGEGNAPPRMEPEQ